MDSLLSLPLSLRLTDLAKRRRRALAKQARQARSAGQDTATAEATPPPVHPAITDPSRWWRYDAALDPDLVVITPALEGDSGLDAAGPLPLAEEPRFPDANRRFLEHIRAHGERMGSLALSRAMGNGLDGAAGAGD